MDALQVDELKLYMSNDIKIADGVVLRVPTIGEIVEYGEQQYFSMASTICSTPSSMKATLDDMKLDWMKVTDFQLFMMLCKSLPLSATKPLLGNLDLQSLKPYPFGKDEVVLSNEDHTITINEVIYEILVTYIRKMHGFKKQVDKAGNEITKMMLIKVARDDAKKAENKPYKSFLRPLISSVKCRMGYTMEYVKKMGIYELTDDLSRLGVIVNADAALTGSWSGMVDTKKIPKETFDWTRDITEDVQKNNKTILKEGAN